MSETQRKPREKMNWLGLFSFGFFILLVGIIWLSTPGLSDDIVSFLTPENWHNQQIFGGILFPYPKANYPILYTAVMEFCFIFAIFHVVVLAIRFGLRESINRKAGTVSSIAFWFSAGAFVYWLANGTIGWLSFIGGIVVSVGLAIVASSIVRLFR
jgi:hypothetical protein